MAIVAFFFLFMYFPFLELSFDLPDARSRRKRPPGRVVVGTALSPSIEFCSRIARLLVKGIKCHLSEGIKRRAFAWLSKICGDLHLDSLGKREWHRSQFMWLSR